MPTGLRRPPAHPCRRRRKRKPGPETPLQLEYAPQAPTFRELEPGPASAPQLSDADDLDTFERIYRSKKEREEESFKLQKDTLYNTWSREFDRTSDNVRRAFKTDTIIFSSSTEERDIWGRVIDRDDKKQSELKDETYEIYGGTPKKEPLADTDDEEHWQDPATYARSLCRRNGRWPSRPYWLLYLALPPLPSP